MDIWSKNNISIDFLNSYGEIYKNGTNHVVIDNIIKIYEQLLNKIYDYFKNLFVQLSDDIKIKIKTYDILKYLFVMCQRYISDNNNRNKFCDTSGILTIYTNYNFYVTVHCDYRLLNEYANIWNDNFYFEILNINNENVPLIDNIYNYKYIRHHVYNNNTHNPTLEHIINVEYGKLHCTEENFKKYVYNEIKYFVPFVHPMVLIDTLYNNTDIVNIPNYFNKITIESQCIEQNNISTQTEESYNDQTDDIDVIKLDELFFNNIEIIDKIANSYNKTQIPQMSYSNILEIKEYFNVVYDYFNNLLSEVFPIIKFKISNMCTIIQLIKPITRMNSGGQYYSDTCIDKLIIYTNYNFYIECDYYHHKYNSLEYDIFHFSIKNYDKNEKNNIVYKIGKKIYNEHDNTNETKILTNLGEVICKSRLELIKFIYNNHHNQILQINKELLVDYCLISKEKIKQIFNNCNNIECLKCSELINDNNILRQNNNELNNQNKTLFNKNKILENTNEQLISESLEKDILINKLSNDNNILNKKYQMILQKDSKTAQLEVI